MTEDEANELVSRVVARGELKATPIPRAANPTPDLLVVGDQRYVIEVKTKEDDPGEAEELKRQLAAGKVAEFASPFIPTNVLSRVLRKGVEQIRNGPERDLSLVWLIATGLDRQGQYEQFRSTLYGLTNVTALDSRSLIPCYYLKDSAFFRWKDELDGAVISTPSGGELCINSLSPRAGLLRGSQLARLFGNSVVFPPSLEATGQAYIADCDVPRKNEDEVLSYLQKKYSLSPLMTFNLGTLGMYLELPDS